MDPISPTERQDAGRRIATILVLSGIVTIAFGVGLGLAIGPVFYAIAALGLFDFVLAWLFASGRIGPQSARRAAAEAGDAAAIAEADRSFNPYARED